MRVFTLAITADKVQVTAAVYWRQQPAALLSKLDCEVTFTNSAAVAAASLQPPDWYMTATYAIAGIADAMFEMY